MAVPLAHGVYGFWSAAGHQMFMARFDRRCQVIRAQVRYEIRRKFQIAFAPPVDDQLWMAVQLIVYPDRCPSVYPPFPQDECGPSWRQASWLYHLLASDAKLRAQVLPTTHNHGNKS